MAQTALQEVETSMKKILDQRNADVEKVKAAKKVRRKNTIKNLDSLCELIQNGDHKHDSEEAKAEALPEPQPLVS
jgi:hypothetical protein